ncbi:MAG: DUF1700 domain-containing protein [Anaeroplasmataceae bacterium]|nr:DUF1700 domain-containing protein [Anaeroplasmataceae bacterium]
MRKREFLRRLGNELSHLDRDERNDILDYYDELIEDTIEKTGKTEGNVIYDLGEIEDIARRVDPSHRRKIRYEEEDEDRTYHKRREEERKTDHKKKRSSGKIGVGLVLLICLFPLWITIFALLFSGIVVIASAGIGCFAGGVVCIWHGCTFFASSWAQALFKIGVGVTLIGIVLIVGPLLMKIIVFIGHMIISFFKWLFGGRRKTTYEN